MEFLIVVVVIVVVVMVSLQSCIYSLCKVCFLSFYEKVTHEIVYIYCSLNITE